MAVVGAWRWNHLGRQAVLLVNGLPLTDEVGPAVEHVDGLATSVPLVDRAG